MKNDLFSHLWQRILEINRGIFPALTLLFIVFTLTEEFRPSFFTYYFSDWWIIAPLLFSGIIFAVSESREEKLPLSLRIFLTGLFLGLFSMGYLFKISMPEQYYWLIFSCAILVFMIFTVSLLFSDEEIRSFIQNLKKRGLLLVSLILIFAAVFLLYLIYLLLTDPSVFHR